MKKFLLSFILFFAAALFLMANSIAGEKTGINLDDVLGGLGGSDQKMEEENVSTASAIRGLNPVSEKYGAGQKDLSPYIKDVKAMEGRRISKKELHQFLIDEGLGAQGGSNNPEQKRK